MNIRSQNLDLLKESFVVMLIIIEANIGFNNQKFQLDAIAQ